MLKTKNYKMKNNAIKKLNFGCGPEIMKGYVNMDILKLQGVDVVHNFNKFPYPFKDNEFDEIYTSHVLEHLDDLIKVMTEFKIIKRKLNFTRLAFTFLNPIINPFINLSPALYERFFCWILPCAEVIIELEVVK